LCCFLVEVNSSDNISDLEARAARVTANATKAGDAEDSDADDGLSDKSTNSLAQG
jgi:hypothetical protein